MTLSCLSSFRKAASRTRHRITSSARASSVYGILRPSAFAVFRLITSSNFDGCSTGRSAGLVGPEGVVLFGGEVAVRPLILFALILLAGCAPRYQWVKPNATQADFEQDAARCTYEAQAATATYGSSQPTAYTTGGAIGQGIGIGIGRAIENNNLAVLCMRAKGYNQVQIGPQQAYPAVQAPIELAQLLPFVGVEILRHKALNRSLRPPPSQVSRANRSSCLPPSLWQGQTAASHPWSL